MNQVKDEELKNFLGKRWEDVRFDLINRGYVVDCEVATGGDPKTWMKTFLHPEGHRVFLVLSGGIAVVNAYGSTE